MINKTVDRITLYSRDLSRPVQTKSSIVRPEFVWAFGSGAAVSKSVASNTSLVVVMFLGSVGRSSHGS